MNIYLEGIKLLLFPKNPDATTINKLPSYGMYSVDLKSKLLYV